VEKQGSYVKAVLASRPLAYWRGSDVASPAAEDASGNGNSGRYEGGVAFYLEGPQKAAFSMDDVNRAPHFAGGRMRAELSGLLADYTVELWFYNALLPEVRPVSGYLFSRGGGDCLGLLANGKLVVANVEGRTAVALRSWNHVAMTRSGDSLKVYLNGVPEITVESKSTASPAVQFAACAERAETWEGRLDEMAVYPRVLSPAEIGTRLQ